MDNNFEYNKDYNQNLNMDNSCNCKCFEPVRENVCHRYLCYEVPHIIPCHTKIINHHIYRHTYTPVFTQEEINLCENIYDNKCC